MMLSNDDGIWLDDKEKLKDMASRFYSSLFTSNQDTGGNFISGCFPPIKDEMCHVLKVAYSLLETQRALQNMVSLKVLGPNGYQALFFMRTRETTGVAVHHFLGCPKWKRSAIGIN